MVAVENPLLPRYPDPLWWLRAAPGRFRAAAIRAANIEALFWLIDTGESRGEPPPVAAPLTMTMPFVSSTSSRVVVPTDPLDDLRSLRRLEAPKLWSLVAPALVLSWLASSAFELDASDTPLCNAARSQ
jgi:hypothetical protein